MSKIVTICGSTRFKDLILQVGRDLTLEGKIVLLPLVFGHSGDVITDEQKLELDKLHHEKIDLSEEVHVVMFDNYIGHSTKGEIEYADLNRIPIIYHNFTDIREDSSCESNIVEVEDHD